MILFNVIPFLFKKKKKKMLYRKPYLLLILWKLKEKEKATLLKALLYFPNNLFIFELFLLQK